MYGSLFKMKALPGKRDEAIQAFMDWETDVKPNSEINGGYLLKSDAEADVFFGMAIAPNEAAYRANNDAPGQAEWYEKLRSLLADDPEWNDGEIIDAN